ncbi:hypothetical protein AVEN_67259-1 [Araneus ventricosus]|uniref:Uncharacterized protein n=1 Tax=Araneus ventricosus TaxID=182803 RepID=A0A4Y2GKJ9_ARAVE|nr:hypothetical protein AVEN_67259-1 [Araneus ventricosus]
MASFPYGIFSISSLSEGDFSSKTQNLMFARSSKDDNSKSDDCKILFVRNDLQLTPTVPEMNSRWLCVFLISAVNIQKRYFPSNEHLREFLRPFREFIDSTL